MRAKLVNESLSKRSNDSKSFGQKIVMNLAQKYLPYLNVSFFDYDREGDMLEDEYKKWDFLQIETGNEAVDELGVSVFLTKENNDFKIKFYMDSVAFIPDYQNDEYVDTVPMVNLKNFTRKDWDNVFELLKEYVDYDEEEYKETKTKQLNWENEMKDPNSKWIRDNNYKITAGLYSGQWEYNWDEELKKWLNIQDRYFEMKKRGYGVNRHGQFYKLDENQ